MASTGDGSPSSPSPADYQTPLSAATVAANVDLLTSILTRIEAKPLMRFKSVSKHWLSLISSLRFSRLHTLQNPNPKPSAIFFTPIHKGDSQITYEFVPLNNSSLSRSFSSLPFDPDPSSVSVLSSCDGLLLCSTFHNPLETDDHYVYNPATKQVSVFSPVAGSGMLSFSATRYSLAFDPSNSPHYKVIMVRVAPGTNTIGGGVIMTYGESGWVKTSSKEMFEIHIYSSENRSWKKHEEEIEWPDFFMFDEGVYLNGAMHWCSKKSGSICFDVNRECPRRMPELPGFRGWDESVLRYFGKSGGDELNLVDIQGFQVMEIDVYVLRRDYSWWSRKYRIDMKPLLSSYPNLISCEDRLLAVDFYRFSLLGILQVGEDDDELVLHVRGKVISYSCKSRTTKELRCKVPGKIYTCPVYRLRSFLGHFYYETLACV